ncbi:ParB N-terminal domain-containing protein [Actinoallomurus rhizosphaericola]|uniref:hypothetical protein n=1 Tax=Actinoallomurus rhizosphaericola TaxID=2952536 RepID=UPI0020935AB5|nr:hypothetical protein [Actinoallomurus rhizosphaericola]MCO5996276.1 hypothetical protein [Actinoallomurus rhizosphaericola]
MDQAQTYRYQVYVLQETESSKPLLLFAANALEISEWAGIPQRRRLSGEETVGWQREENPGRLRELAKFFDDGSNVVQNPLLCALQDPQCVTFKPLDGLPNFGELVIRASVKQDTPLLEVLELLSQRLESRVPSLKDYPIDADRRRKVRERARFEDGLHPQLLSDPTDLAVLESDEDPSTPQVEENEAEDVASVVLTEETQLVDFYQELRIRIEILRELPVDARPSTLVGFSADAMLSYLQPVVLVDGQHRLHGAVLSAKKKRDTDKLQDLLIDQVNKGISPAEAERDALHNSARMLPVSLLFDANPAEHVFQFVVVNQKATPMGKALLGTIVSTSLSREELEPVADRLRRASIPLDDSQSVSYMTRAEESPFRGLVQTGMGGDDRRHLQWSVLKGLTQIFRELKGGKVFGQTNDYAELWQQRHLGKSDLVSQGESLEEKYRIWREPDGPWRSVFVRFFSIIRDRFGDSDPEAHNAWGNSSKNLYNKISLTILSADYFQFLCETKTVLNDLNDVNKSVEDWLEGVNNQYFARDWRMDLKKDQRRVRETWATVWVEYRKNPARLPRVERYTPSS